jgi:hypothetical protein
MWGGTYRPPDPSLPLPEVLVAARHTRWHHTGACWAGQMPSKTTNGHFSVEFVKGVAVGARPEWPCPFELPHTLPHSPDKAAHSASEASPRILVQSIELNNRVRRTEAGGAPRDARPSRPSRTAALGRQAAGTVAFPPGLEPSRGTRTRSNAFYG